MAFSRENIDPNASGSKGTGTYAVYSTTTDNKATVKGPGYFNTVADEMRRVAVILIQATDATFEAKVAVSAAGVVTLSAVDGFA